jgi:hypothetical protein
VAQFKQFQLHLKSLDKLPTRESIKLALVYVGEHQEEQEAILKNETASGQYREFSAGLAWNVRMATHRGYLVKLVVS